ncbi:MAG: gamma-glutamylcyclotransferase family protein [Polyangiales bacterium]
MPTDPAATLYFAYGSNLDETQMRRRCASARRVGVATLPDYALSFDGHSRVWCGPVASLLPLPGSLVHGLVYDLQACDLAALDRFEGYPSSYTRIEVSLSDASGAGLRALTYVRPSGDPRFTRGAPPVAYLTLLEQAYQRHGFDLGLLSAAARWPR